MKFPAEVKSYHITNRIEGKVAVIKIEVPTTEIAKSGFIGDLVGSFADFSVDNVRSLSQNINE